MLRLNNCDVVGIFSYKIDTIRDIFTVIILFYLALYLPLKKGSGDLKNDCVNSHTGMAILDVLQLFFNESPFFFLEVTLFPTSCHLEINAI